MPRKTWKRHRWNTETMNDFCKENARGYIVLDSKYIDKGYQKQLWAFVKCPNPYHEPYWVCWNNFRRGNHCKKCFYDENNFVMWDKQMAYDYCLEHGYEMLDINDFKNVDSPFYCYDKDGFIVSVTITNLRQVINDNGKQRGFSIIKNNKYAKYNIDLFCSLYRPDYEFVSEEYTGVKDPHWFRYNGDFLRDETNKREFLCTVDCFINGRVSHPNLTKSSGEIKVENFFIKNNINYVAQKTFDDCKDKYVLPFDFYLPDYNAVCEVQGKQHYEPVEYFGGQKQFEYVKRHDKIKYNYCKDNNIDIIYVPYWNLENIEQILKDKLCL